MVTYKGSIGNTACLGCLSLKYVRPDRNSVKFFLKKVNLRPFYIKHFFKFLRLFYIVHRSKFEKNLIKTNRFGLIKKLDWSEICKLPFKSVIFYFELVTKLSLL